MRKLFSAIFSVILFCAGGTINATSYNYKAAPVDIEIEDLSSKYINEYKLIITQYAKNTAEYSKQTTYYSIVELYLYPDEHSIAGTFSSKDGSISDESFVQYNSNYRFLNTQATSTFTIVSKGGNRYAITEGKLVVKNNAGNVYTYNYCYAEDDLNDSEAPVTPFEFEYKNDPLPEKWDEIGTSTVTDSVISLIPGNAGEVAPYLVTTLQNDTLYKFVDLFGNGNGSYTKADIVVNAANPDNVRIERQSTGRKNDENGHEYFITASNGRYIEGMITFAASDCIVDEDGRTLESPAGGLTFIMPGTPLEFDTIAVTAVDFETSYFPDSKECMVIMHDANGSLYGFDIYTSESGLENGRTYSSRNRDFNPDYTYAWIGEEPDYALKSSFVRTEEDDVVRVNATIAAESGRLYLIEYTVRNVVPQSVESTAEDGITHDTRIISLDGRIVSEPMKGRIYILDGVKTLFE